VLPSGAWVVYSGISTRPAAKRKWYIKPGGPIKKIIALIFFVVWAGIAEGQTLTASWYSIDSLKKEGTYKYSKGVMANGKRFSDDIFTCASCDFKLGSRIAITNYITRKQVIAEVTDRTNRRFKGKRIDLSRAAFYALTDGDLERGLCEVYVTEIK